jgi:hypothetical protein
LTMDFLGHVRRPFELAPKGYTDAIVGKRYMTIWHHAARRGKQRHRKAAREALWSASR